MAQPRFEKKPQRRNVLVSMLHASIEGARCQHRRRSAEHLSCGCSQGRAAQSPRDHRRYRQESYRNREDVLSRQRRRHLHCAGMGMPVLKTTASERRSFWVPACPCPRNGHAVGDAEMRMTGMPPMTPFLRMSSRPCGSKSSGSPILSMSGIFSGLI